MKIVNPKIEGVFLWSQLISSITGGTVLGWLLDEHFNTIPLFLLIGIFMGVGSGFVFVYRYAKATEDRV